MWGFIIGVLCAGVGAWILVQYFRQNNRLLHEELQRVEQEKTLVLEFLHNLVEEVKDDSPRGGLQRRIIHAAVMGTGAVSGCLFAPAADGRLRAVAVEGVFPRQRQEGGQGKRAATRAEFLQDKMSVADIPIGKGILGRVAETREPVLVNDEQVLEKEFALEDPVFRMRSFLAVPILFRKRFLGVIAVVNSSDGFGFSETDFSLVVSLGEQAGLAIHNADQIETQMEKQRLDLDLSLAANVQGMLLPLALPRFEGIELAAAYETAQRVGGDLYNVFSLPENRVGLAIGDVSGKGVAASLLMSICQTSLSLIGRGGDPPAQVLSRLNREIIHQIRPEMFVTMIYAVIDLGAGRVRLARAGHELPVLCLPKPGDEGVRCQRVSSDGMALGMVAPDVFDSTVEEVEFDLGEGSSLVLFTDGVTERTNSDGIEFGTARLLDTLHTLGGRSAEETKDAILSRLDRFSADQAAADDMTLLVVRSTAKRV